MVFSKEIKQNTNTTFPSRGWCARADAAGEAWGAVPWGQGPQNPSFPASGFRAGSPGCARHRDGLSSKIPGRAPSASPPALLGFSACQSGCICHLTVELVGKSPCSYRDWAVKSSISVDVFASASEFFSWLAVGMSQGAGNDWSCSPNTWHCT